MKKIATTLLLCAMPLVFMPVADAANKKKSASNSSSKMKLYRFKDENGRTRIEDKVSAKWAKRGYEIVDLNGRVLDVVAPALTDEQKDAARKGRAKQAAAEAKRDRDIHLLKHYSKVSDLEITRDRVLREIQFSIKIVESNLLAQQEQVEFQQKRAADLERKGRKVPQKNVEAIAQLNEAIAHSEQDLIARNEEYKETQADYEEDITRLRRLLEERGKRYRR